MRKRIGNPCKILNSTKSTDICFFRAIPQTGSPVLDMDVNGSIVVLAEVAHLQPKGIQDSIGVPTDNRIMAILGGKVSTNFCTEKKMNEGLKLHGP